MRFPRLSSVIPYAIAGAGLYLLYRLTKDRLLNSLSFRIEKIRADFLSAVPILFLDVSVNNPTPAPIRVDGINGRVLVNDTLVGTVDQREPVLFSGHEATSYTIPVKISVLSLAANFQDLFKTNSVFKFDGTIQIEKIDFPIELTYRLFV